MKSTISSKYFYFQHHFDYKLTIFHANSAKNPIFMGCHFHPYSDRVVGSKNKVRENHNGIATDDKRILEPLCKLALELAFSYQLNLELTFIFNIHVTPEEVRSRMEKPVRPVTESDIKCFNEFMAILNNDVDMIANYFDGRHTNCFVKGINNKVKVLKRRCYGLSNITRLFQRIILNTTGLQRFATG